MSRILQSASLDRTGDEPLLSVPLHLLVKAHPQSPNPEQAKDTVGLQRASRHHTLVGQGTRSVENFGGGDDRASDPVEPTKSK